MINALIIEDERSAADNLIYHLERVNEEMNILAVTESVADSIQWLQTHPTPDLIFMDIQLKDGLSFCIFEEMKVNAPVVFVTAYDNYLVKAFEQNSIEFLLKPIDEQMIQHTIAKYKGLKEHFFNKFEKVLDIYPGRKKRSRIIVKKGIEFQSILLSDIAYFFTEHKITFLVTRDEKKYMVDQNLRELEDDLDKEKFYRANRKYIINIEYVKSYRPYDKIKLDVEMFIPPGEPIIISQESAGDFKRWMNQL